MRKALIPLALLAAAPLLAADKPALPAPSEIVAGAPRADWTAIAASDLLVMDLTPAAKDKPRRVVIQLMPAPFSQGWIGNIRKLAAAHWWDGLAVTRVQDNYVAQWGDPDGEDKAKARKLPDGLATVPESGYMLDLHSDPALLDRAADMVEPLAATMQTWFETKGASGLRGDRYASLTLAWQGWPLAIEDGRAWPVHCYGMVGVGRNMSPDTGSGAELYTVIGHAPRHLDRNIALVGRVIEGIEHLSSLPRGTGPLGVYESRAEQVPITAIRLGSAVPGLPAYEYLSTESESFAKYAEARANRRDAFFIRPAGGADICNIPVPVRRAQ